MSKLLIGNIIPIESRHSEKRLRIKIPKGRAIKKIAFVPRVKQTKMPTSSIFFGVGSAAAVIDEAFVESLTKSEEKTKSKVLPVNAGGLSKVYYARPKSWGLAQFKIEVQEGVIEGGFLAPVEVTINDDETGASEVYYVYESVSLGLQGTLYII